MKIGQKLTLAFVGIALLIGVAGYISLNTSQKALQESIGESTVSLAVETLKNIDMTIYSRIEEFQAYATGSKPQEITKKSNEEFEKLGDIQSYIAQKDKEWTSAPKETVTSFMWELESNEVARDLKQRLKFYEEKYSYRVFGEVFITNKYGVNVAQTGKTTDYYQADEHWWQVAKNSGLYIEDVEYDRSANVYSTDIGIRIDDKDRNFLGAIKVILNIENVIEIMTKAKKASPYKTTELKLFDKKGKVIFDTSQELKPFKDTLDENILKRTREKAGYLLKTGETSEGDELFAYVHSNGYRDYMALGWILAIEHEAKEIFAPVTDLKDRMLIVPLTVTIVAVLIGLLISRSISKPIIKFRDAAIEIGKGRLDTTVEIDSKDEIGELANSFNKMAEHLNETIYNLNREIIERKKAEEALEKLNKDLESTVQELSRSNKELQGFAHIIAHDLKAPLRAIGTLTDWLAMDYTDNFDQQGKEWANLIVKRAKRIDKVIDSILLYSEVGRIGLKKKIVDLNVVLSEVICEIGQPENIEITIENKLPTIMCNRRQMMLVFQNLLSNAVRYMDKPKGQIKVGCTEEDNFWKFSICDNGPGIEKKYFEKIFKIFQTLLPRDELEAIGVGLSLTEKIVDLYGGRIWVQSKPGEGSTFYFTLPEQEMGVKDEKLKAGTAC